MDRTYPTQKACLLEPYSVGTVDTAHNQILHCVHSGQLRADAKCCVPVHSLYHQACAAVQLSMCFLSLALHMTTHSCTAASTHANLPQASCLCLCCLTVDKIVQLCVIYNHRCRPTPSCMCRQGTYTYVYSNHPAAQHSGSKQMSTALLASLRPSATSAPSPPCWYYDLPSSFPLQPLLDVTQTLD